MACCVALGLFITACRWLWLRLTFRAPPPRVLFAPPARRPAPGETGVPAPVAADAMPRPVPLFRTPAGGAVAGLAAYLLAVVLLLPSGLLGEVAGPGLWLLRTALFAAVAALLLRPSLTAVPASSANVAAMTLYFAGLGWLVAGIADLHLFSLFAPSGTGHHDALSATAAPGPVLQLFYGFGLTALVAGLMLSRNDPPASRSPEEYSR